jgi:hypothetical protein
MILMVKGKEFSLEKVLSPRFAEIYRVAVRYTLGVRMETLGPGESQVENAPTVKVLIHGNENKKQTFDDKVSAVTQRVGGVVVSFNPAYWYPVHRIRKHYGGKKGKTDH